MARRKATARKSKKAGAKRSDARNPSFRNRITGLEEIPASRLHPHPANWRTHPDAQRKAVAATLRQIGYADALVVRRLEKGRRREGEQFEILDGHLRADLSPDRAVPCLVVDLNDAEARQFLLSCDPLAAMAEADAEALAKLLAEVEVADADLQAMLDELAREAGTVLGSGEPVDPEPQIDRAAELQKQWGTATGQLWEVPSKTVAGKCHRVLCGDCREAIQIARLCAEKVNGCFTSPPYAEQRKAQYGGIPADEYVSWWELVQGNVRDLLSDDGSFFVNIKPNAEGLDTELYVFDLVCAMVRRWGWHFATEFCWERNGVPKGVTRRFKNQFEPVYQFALGEWKMRPESVSHPSSDVPMSLGKGSGNTGWADRQGKGGAIAANRMPQRTGPTMAKHQGEKQPVPLHLGSKDSIGEGLAYPGNRLPAFTSSHEALGHAAAFPIGLPSFFIKAFSDPADHWLDPFLGSGSTLIAAEQLGRLCYGIEIEPKYVAVILQRCKDLGLEPRLAPEG